MVGLREIIDSLKDQAKERETAEKALKIQVVEQIAERTKMADKIQGMTDKMVKYQKEREEKSEEIADLKK